MSEYYDKVHDYDKVLGATKFKSLKDFEDYMLKEHDMMLVQVPGQGNCQFIAALVPILLWAAQ
eukprot:3070935-Pleurochrysis_carterae.AAC.1